MIKKGALTVMDYQTYTCVDIKDGYAYLKNVLHEQGRPKKVKLALVPYFDDEGVFHVPEQPKIKKNYSRIHLNQLVRATTDMPVSRTFSALLHEWIESSVSDMVAWAEENAKKRKHKKISAQHLYWWQLGQQQDPNGLWPMQEDYVKER